MKGNSSCHILSKKGKENYSKIFSKNKCPKCFSEMKPSKALLDILEGIPDFIGTTEVCTVSACGKAKLINCLKCTECGFSIST